MLLTSPENDLAWKCFWRRLEMEMLKMLLTSENVADHVIDLA